MTTEMLIWHSADTKPDCDITMLCWDGETPYFCGWWDDVIDSWIDAASGSTVFGVTHWASPEGPQA